ncbi:hypothetical protein LCGC14_0500220 [marine sediment metagenome]|uniref:Uncharacterized protein n=1 Tax=marine sediment metagenome TaxID=412755 RepID=A0A0F9S948_9ZZZZ
MGKVWETKFTPEGERRMVYLEEKLGLSRGDVVERALTYYRALWDEKDKGATVVFHYEGSELRELVIR